MANKKFTDFDLATSLTDNDYIIGYKANATAELRTTFETLRNSLPDDFKYQGTDLKDLSGNWEETFSTVQSNSATNWDNSLANDYSDSKFLPLTGGDLTGTISLSNVQVEAGTTLSESLSSLVITINGQQYKIPLLAI